MSTTFKIGAWEFSAETGSLSQAGTETRRLEHRAAALLEYFCQHSQELVLHADIIDKVWGGRSISSNSVAVVVAGIRRELGDDARSPEYIETLPKRGYRLIALVTKVELETLHSETKEPSKPDVSPFRRRALGFWIAGIISVGIIVLLAQFLQANKAPVHLTAVSISTVENRTEDTGYDALSQALSELLTSEIMRTGEFKVTPEDGADILLTARLTLWSGEPSLALHARSESDQAIIWSGMANGAESRLPAQVRRQVNNFSKKMDELAVNELSR